MTTSPAVPALAALAVRVADANRLTEDAAHALARGEVTLALGTVVPVEQLLKDALALFHAAVVLHLEAA